MNHKKLTDSFDDKRIETLIFGESKALKMIEIFAVPFQSQRTFDEHFAAQLIAFSLFYCLVVFDRQLIQRLEFDYEM